MSMIEHRQLNHRQLLNQLHIQVPCLPMFESTNAERLEIFHQALELQSTSVLSQAVIFLTTALAEEKREDKNRKRKTCLDKHPTDVAPL